MATGQVTCCYAVRYGRLPGVYTTWGDCKKQIKGYPGASVSMFTTREEAEAYLASFPELLPEVPKLTFDDKFLSSSPVTEDCTIYVEGIKGGCYGGFWGHKHIRNFSGSFKTGTLSRQRAILHAINHAIYQSVDDPGLVRIVVDSRHILGAVKKLNRWASNDWKQKNGSELKNKDVYERTLNGLRLKKGQVKFIDGSDAIFQENMKEAKKLGHDWQRRMKL